MPRLSENDWLDHGLKTLAMSGFAAIKAASMAETLGVSRGSFYWHFKDLRDFQVRLLDHWQSRTTDATIQDLDAKDRDHDRLSDLMARAYAARPELDRAVRVWAEYDEEARKRLNKVDKLRIDYIRKLLKAEGLKDGDARRRARFLYAASLGDAAIAPDAAARLSSADLKSLAALLAH
ncbi:MAG: TetR/AcrR family transcriptional regulator [Pseudomonadota bacterium]